MVGGTMLHLAKDFAHDVLKCIVSVHTQIIAMWRKNTHHFPMMLAGSSWTELKVDAS